MVAFEHPRLSITAPRITLLRMNNNCLAFCITHATGEEVFLPPASNGSLAHVDIVKHGVKGPSHAIGELRGSLWDFTGTRIVGILCSFVVHVRHCRSIRHSLDGVLKGGDFFRGRLRGSIKMQRPIFVHGQLPQKDVLFGDVKSDRQRQGFERL